MILTVIAEYNRSPIIKLLSIDESNAELEVLYVDTSDAGELKELKEKLDEGLTYADFSIFESELEDGAKSYELMHYCNNIAPGEPVDNITLLDELSLTGLIRYLITEGGQVVLPMKDNPENNIPHWMVASLSTAQFTNSFGVKFAHLVPSNNLEGYWKWFNTSLFEQLRVNEFNDHTKLRFLVPIDFVAGDFSQIISPYKTCSVVGEDGRSTVYKEFSIIDKDLPHYPSKSNLLMVPETISRIKYVADSYKLSLMSLTSNLFEKKKIDTDRGSYEYTGSGDRDLYVKFNSKPAISKKTADTMLDFYIKRLTKEAGRVEERQFIKTYPHYQVYSSIIAENSPLFFGEETSMVLKFRKYQELKNAETLLNLLLAEIRYNIMFANNSFHLNRFTEPGVFQTGIPNYTVHIEGGGIGWHPRNI